MNEKLDKVHKRFHRSEISLNHANYVLIFFDLGFLQRWVFEHFGNPQNGIVDFWVELEINPQTKLFDGIKCVALAFFLLNKDLDLLFWVMSLIIWLNRICLNRYKNFSDSVIQDTQDLKLDMSLIQLKSFFKIQKSWIIADDIISHDIWMLIANYLVWIPLHLWMVQDSLFDNQAREVWFAMESLIFDSIAMCPFQSVFLLIKLWFIIFSDL